MQLGWDLYEAEGWPAAEPEFEAALRLIPADPPSLERARVMAHHGRFLAVAGRYDEAEPVLGEALALVRLVDSGDLAVREIECWAIGGLAQCRWLRSDLIGALELSGLRPPDGARRWAPRGPLRLLT